MFPSTNKSSFTYTLLLKDASSAVNIPVKSGFCLFAFNVSKLLMRLSTSFAEISKLSNLVETIFADTSKRFKRPILVSSDVSKESKRLFTSFIDTSNLTR